MAIWATAGLIAACAIGAWFAPKAFFEVWLVAWIFWSGLSFGGLILLMLQALTGGAWAQAVRSPCLALVGTVPAAAVLFVPVLLGAGWIYPWTNREIFTQHYWPHKELWLRCLSSRSCDHYVSRLRDAKRPASPLVRAG